MNKECAQIICSFINNIGQINFSNTEERNIYANNLADSLIELSNNDDLKSVWEFYPEELTETAKLIKKIHPLNKR